MTPFKPIQLHEELEKAGIPISGCDGLGNVQFKPNATKAQIAKVEQIKQAHKPRWTDAELSAFEMNFNQINLHKRPGKD